MLRRGVGVVGCFFIFWVWVLGRGGGFGLGEGCGGCVGGGEGVGGSGLRAKGVLRARLILYVGGR